MPKQTVIYDKEVVLHIISQKLARAREIINECVELADKSGVAFNLPWGGEGSSERGLGGCYVPANADDKTIQYLTNDGETTGWQPSSQSC